MLLHTLMQLAILLTVSCYTEDLLVLEAASHYEVSLPGDCYRVTTLLKADVREHLLSAHPDRRYVKFIIDGIRREASASVVMLKV